MKNESTFANMPMQKKFKDIYFILLYIIPFTLPFAFIYTSISIAIFSILWVAQANLKQITNSLKHNKALWAWLIFFLLHLVSYTYSTDKSQSAFDIERKLSFLLLPLAIGTGPKIERKNLNNILLSFIAGLTIAALYCMLRAGYYWRATGDSNYFFYHKLVTNLAANAVYFSWYIIFSLATLLFYTWSNYFFNPRKWIYYVILLIQATFFVLLSSRLLLTLSVALVFPTFIYTSIKHKKISKWQTVLFIGVVASLTTFLSKTENPIRSRFEDVIGKNEQAIWIDEKIQINKQEFNNLSLRLFLWQNAWENINEHNLWWNGCGNGDVTILQKEKIIKDYNIDKNNITDTGSELWYFNLHNMYLQVLMMLGIPGLIVFLIIVFSPFFYLKYSYAKTPFFIFFTISALFMLQESALQTQAGIIYFTFFTQIFWNLYYSERNQEKSQFQLAGK